MTTRKRTKRLMINKPKPDLISELPDPVIQHIMSCLPYKYAARMSILSKRFASAWASFPIIFFDQTLNMGSCLELRGERKLKSFLSYVENFLSRRPQKISLEKFSFRFFLYKGPTQPNYSSIFENAVSYAIENKVKDLELDMCGDRFKFMAHYGLPKKVLSAQTITVLSLKGFVLEPLQNFNLNFPFIKELKLEKCKGMQTLSVSSQTLKILAIKFCQGLEKIDVDSLNLESFSFTGGRNSPCSINITACKSLIYLYLENARITDEWIKHEVAPFSRLEVFKVVSCRLLKNFHVSNAYLKTVELSLCSTLEKIEIYSRRLNTFVFDGLLIPSQVFIYSPSFDAKVSLTLRTDHQPPHDWFSSFRDFLSRFGYCKVLEIAFDVGMALIVPIDFRDNFIPPLCDLNYLKLSGICPTRSEYLVDLLGSLLWSAPRLTLLSFVSPSKEKSLKFDYHIELPIDEDLECCYSKPLKCWRHHLKGVIMKNFEDRENMILQEFFAQKAIRLEAISKEDNDCGDALAEAGVSQGSGSVVIQNINDLWATTMPNIFFYDDDILENMI